MSSLYYNTVGTLVAEVFPLESNGTDNLSTPRFLVDVEFLDKSFTVPRDAFVVNDDVSERFVQGFVFDVIGGGPYDGTYTVDASGFTPGDVVAQVIGGQTHIPVVDIADTATPIAYDFRAGFTTPSVSPTTPHNYLITWEVDGDITGAVSVNDSVQFKHVLYNDNVTNTRINRTYTVTGLTYSGSGYTTVVTSLTDEHSASITPIIGVDIESTFVTPVPESAPFGYVQYTVPTASTSLRLVGRGVPMYNNTMSWGHALQTNMINLMENFANPTAPDSPLPGQLWFNSAENSMWVYYTSAWHGVVSEGVPTQGNVTMSNYTMAEVGDAVTTYPYVASLTGWGNNDQEAMNLRTSDLLYIAKTGGYDADPAVRSGTMTGSLNLTGAAGLNFKAAGSGSLTFEATSTGGIDVLGSGSVTVAAGDITATAGNVTVGSGTDLVVVQNNPGNAPTITFTTATTGNNVIDLSSNMITGLTAPVDPADAANKEYVDMFVSGIVWMSPVLDPTVFNDSLSSPPVDDGFTTHHKTFIVSGTGTGDWAGYDGHLMAWTGTSWESVLGRPVAPGDRFGVFCEPDPHDPLSVLPGGSFAGVAGKIATVNTVSPYTYTFYTPAEPDAFSVVGTFGNASAYQSPHMGHSYTFRGQYGVGTFGTGYTWIEFAGPQTIIAGYSIGLFNVQTYGAVGSGLVDDAPAINSAIAACAAAGGGIVYFPAGHYRCNSNLLIADGYVTLMGQGKYASVIEIHTTAGNGVAFTGSSLPLCAVRDLGIAAYVASTGALLATSGVFRFSLLNTMLNGAPGGPNLSTGLAQLNGTSVLVDGVDAVGATGFGILCTGGNDYVIDNTTVQMNGVTGKALHIDSVSQGAVSMSNAYFLEGANCLIENSSYINMVNTFFDSAQGAVEVNGCTHVYGTTTEAANRVTTGSGDGGGWKFVASSNFAVSNSMIINNGGTGITIDAACSDFDISHNQVDGNNTADTASTNGITIAGGATNFTVIANRVGNITAGFGGHQKLGIEVTAGASNNYIIRDNIVLDNETAGLVDAGTGTTATVENNLGYNPLGISVVTPPATTATYVAGHASETIYLNGGTVTAIKLPNDAGSTVFSTTPCTLHLRPGETFSITYTVAPTMSKQVH